MLKLSGLQSALSDVTKVTSHGCFYLGAFKSVATQHTTAVGAAWVCSLQEAPTQWKAELLFIQVLWNSLLFANYLQFKI